MATGKMFLNSARELIRESVKKSGYIETRSYDGGKSVNFDRFLKDAEVRRQMDRAKEIIAEQRAKRASTQ